MDKGRMAELEKIEAHGAENGWVAPMTEVDRESFAYFRSVFKLSLIHIYDAIADSQCGEARLVHEFIGAGDGNAQHLGHRCLLYTSRCV